MIRQLPLAGKLAFVLKIKIDEMSCLHFESEYRFMILLFNVEVLVTTSGKSYSTITKLFVKMNKNRLLLL